jgi:hypothetical protein
MKIIAFIAGMVLCAGCNNFQEKEVRDKKTILSEEATLLQLVKNDRLIEYNTNNIPDFVIRFLSNVLGNTASFAGPGEAWNAGCVRHEGYDIQNYELLAFCLGQNSGIITFRSGGFVTSEHIYSFSFDKDSITSYWNRNLALADSSVTSKQMALSYLEKYMRSF